MKKLIFILAILLPAMAQAQSLPNFPLNKVFNVVQTDAALRAFPVAGLMAGTQIKDNGYYVNGDMPPVVYSLQTSACSLNSGAGDGGGQIPSNTTGYCWIMGSQVAYDFRQWGAVPSGVGADPNNNNATLMTNAITYVGNIGNLLPTGAEALVMTGGGLQYTINAPVINYGPSGFIEFQDFGLLVNSSTNFTCTNGALENLASSLNYFDRIIIDVNGQTANGFYDQANGTNRMTKMFIRHWSGSCASTTTTGTMAVTSGSNIVTDTNTSTLATGMVSRGNTASGIPDRSVIVNIVANTSFTLSNAATASSTPSSLAFYTDVNGVSMGKGGTNTGGSFHQSNIFEWDSGQSQNGINADRYGYGIACYSGCNDVAVDSTAFVGGVSNVYLDSGSGGIRFVNVEMNNSTWNSAELNPKDVLEADNGGPLKFTAVDMNGGSAQIFVTDSAGNSPYFTWDGGGKSTTCTNCTYTPNAIVSVYSSYTGTTTPAVLISPMGFGRGGQPLFATYGPGTFTSGPSDFDFQGGTIDNAIIGANTQQPGTFSTLASNNAISAGANSLISGGDFKATGTGNPVNGMNNPATNEIALYANSTKMLEVLGTAGSRQAWVDGGLLSEGTTYTTTGSCAPTSKIGGADSGSFLSGVAGTCAVVITINGANGSTAPNGWACTASDLTTPADKINETAYTTTTATISGTTASGDLIAFSCKGF